MSTSRIVLLVIAIVLSGCANTPPCGSVRMHDLEPGARLVIGQVDVDSGAPADTNSRDTATACWVEHRP